MSNERRHVPKPGDVEPAASRSDRDKPRPTSVRHVEEFSVADEVGQARGSKPKQSRRRPVPQPGGDQPGSSGVRPIEFTSPVIEQYRGGLGGVEGILPLSQTVHSLEVDSDVEERRAELRARELALPELTETDEGTATPSRAKKAPKSAPAKKGLRTAPAKKPSGKTPRKKPAAKATGQGTRKSSIKDAATGTPKKPTRKPPATRAKRASATPTTNAGEATRRTSKASKASVPRTATDEATTSLSGDAGEQPSAPPTPAPRRHVDMEHVTLGQKNHAGTSGRPAEGLWERVWRWLREH